MQRSVWCATGVDLFAACAALAAGAPADPRWQVLPAPRSHVRSINLFFPLGTHRVTRCAVPPQAMQWLEGCTCFFNAGDAYSDAHTGSERCIAWLCASGATPGEAEAKLRRGLASCDFAGESLAGVTHAFPTLEEDALDVHPEAEEFHDYPRL